MSKAVEVWRCHPRGDRQMKRRQKFMKRPTDSVSPYRRPLLFAEGEHREVWRNRPVTRLFLLQEGRHRLGHPWAKRYEPVFPEFCLPNHQKLGIKIDILAA